jgi:hypothetical protein
MSTYEVIERHATEENTEIRLAKINRGYTIGVWDLDAKGYATNLTIYPHTMENAEDQARAFYNEQVRLADPLPANDREDDGYWPEYHETRGY